MDILQKRHFGLLIVISVIVFIIFIRPNAVASENIAMVLMFEPDEATPLPYVLRMIAPAENLDKALRAFLFYGYYFYGFPHFALSALVLLPLQALGLTDHLPLVMLALRQGVSVLPMLAALLLIVYLQDGFRTYRSVVLFVLFVSVPAVVNNNFWWHPDSLVTLLAVLILYFLWRDNLRLGRRFLAAAFITGILTAAKLVGLYFFLAVGLPLILALILKKATIQKVIGMGFAYMLVMALGFVVGNPFLLSHWARLEYGYTLNKQAALVGQGYGIIYDKSLLAAWPTMHANYGEAVFILLAFGAAVWGAWRGPRRLLYGLILAWFIPLTVSLMTVTHFKYQYWLPVALPLFSCLVLLLPERLSLQRLLAKENLIKASLLVLVAVQFFLFTLTNAQNYTRRVHRADDNPRILFYQQALKTLEPLTVRQTGEPIFVYFDYRMYMPDEQGWRKETSFDLLEYQYIEQRNFDVLLLLEQRIRDYLQEGAQGIDAEVFARNQQFYRDADNAQLRGYHLVYRDPIGLIYVRDDLWQQGMLTEPAE